MSGALQSAFSRLGLSGRLAQQRALLVWPEVVGPQIAAATRPLHVRDGILFVAAKSSAWAHELIFRKAAILEGLEKVLGKGVLTDIRFLGRGYRDDGPPADEQSGRRPPTLEECGQIALSDADIASLKEILAPVTDPELRRRLELVMMRDLRVRRWKEQQGWRGCSRCGLPHPGETDVCGLCRPRRVGR